MQQIDRDRIERAMRGLMDEGRIVEAGWMTYRGQMSPTAPPIQLRECRLAFWHGASFLFQAIMYALEPGKSETPADLRRMDRLAAELGEFEEQFRDHANAARMNYTCSRCGAITHHITDIKLGYCEVCRDWR